MGIKIILACDENQGIGKRNSIPWSEPADLKYFRKQTIGLGNNSVIMGRMTYESIPQALLAQRRNIVISQSLPQQDDVNIVTSLDDALKLANSSDETWIVGGAKIYNETLKLGLGEELHLTRIKGVYDCDTFVNIDFREWQLHTCESLSPGATVYVYRRKIKNNKDCP